MGNSVDTNKVKYLLKQKRKGLLPCFQYSTKKRGFTLSELLISLALLGLISALTLPTIVNNVEQSRKKAIFKEDFNTLANILSTGTQVGELQSFSNWCFNNGNCELIQWLRSKLSPVTDCPNTGSCAPVWAAPLSGYSFILSNGSAIVLTPTTNAQTFGICIDYNGKIGKTVFNSSLFEAITGEVVSLQWNNTGTVFNSSENNGDNLKPYQLGYYMNSGTFQTQYKAMYLWIFS